MLDRIYQLPFPTLKVTDEYELREIRDEDADAYFTYYQEPNVGQYILATDPRSLIEARAELQYCRNLFRVKRGLYWALSHIKTGEMIGAVGLYTNNFHHRTELCYDLNKDYWRQGIMSAALKSTFAYCFREAGIERIEAVTKPQNEASQGILASLGFDFEGILKAYRYYEGGFHDVTMYALTRPMYELIAPPPQENDLDQLLDDMSKS